jgi:hypothetical protein
VETGSRSERDEWRRAHRDEVAEIRRRLRETFAALERWTCSSARELGRSPGPGRWSLHEILEHVTLANHYLLLLIEKIRARCRRRIASGASWPASPPRTEHLRAIAEERTPWPHPAHMQPRAGLAPELIRERLRAALARCEEVLDEMPEGQGTLHRIRMSRLAEDDRLELYQYVDFLGRHAQRHLAQIEDTRRSPGSGGDARARPIG